jgi:hypothetical protein
MVDDLSTLKDDMIAFIEGHGMRRFHGYASEDEVQAIMWNSADQSDGWKDFVELAKHCGAPFLTMHSSALERTDLDDLVQHLADARFGGEFSGEDDAEDARWLRQHVGKVGFIQLGWAYQGSMFLYEASTEWYEQYQHLLEFSEDIGGFTLGESNTDDEP